MPNAAIPVTFGSLLSAVVVKLPASEDAHGVHPTYSHEAIVRAKNVLFSRVAKHDAGSALENELYRKKWNVGIVSPRSAGPFNLEAYCRWIFSGLDGSYRAAITPEKDIEISEAKRRTRLHSSSSSSGQLYLGGRPNSVVLHPSECEIGDAMGFERKVWTGKRGPWWCNSGNV
ncbi:hypothetical protein BU16DRAFT_554113 [Lophium mytilinum]|uniref:Uncharacterized protein n=1 Tax=Lophium mytilinum TaxID=390894 RepID=A0A6A6RB68_9PEZI|nr:hypothetical protein BU16DRAFT_554113 [Lophium mytilinum]